MADYAGIDLGVKLVPDGSDFERRIAAIEKASKPIKIKLDIGGTNGGFSGLGRDVSSFTSYLDRANQRVLAFGASIGTLYGAIRIFKDIVSSTIAVEKELTNINSVLKLSQSSLSSYSKSLFDIARATSSSFEDAAQAATLFSRQGKGVADTLKLTTEALTLSRISGISLTDSVKDLTEAMAVFGKSGLSAKQVVDSLSAVSSRFAITTDDLTEGFTRFGAVAQKAGLNFSQTIGLITAAKSTTQRDGAAIGTALTNIFTKLEPRNVVEGLGRIGVAVKDIRGNVLPLLTVVQNLANSYDQLGESSKAQIDKLVGGARQINILKGALEGLSDANGAYAKSQQVVAQSTDDATRRLQAQNQTLSAMLTNLASTGKQIGANIGNASFSGPLKAVAGAVQTVAQPLEDADGNAKTFGGKVAQGFLAGFGNALLYGAVPLVAKVFGGIVSRTFSTLTRDVSAILNLNGESSKQAAIQKEIVQLYNSGNKELIQTLNLMTSVAEKAALIQGVLSSRSAAGAAQLAETEAIAGVISSRGGIKRAAGGYLPSMAAESAAIAAGVGGAPSSAQPVYLPNVGGGIVANTSEFKVPTSGGTAIFSQNMASQYGLPAGSVPIAPGGYIPGATFNPGSLQTNDPYFKGINVEPQAIEGINSLFDALHKASSLESLNQVGDQVVRFSDSLDKLSKRKVLDQLSESFVKLQSQLEATSPTAQFFNALKSTGKPRGTPKGGYATPEHDQVIEAAEARINSEQPSLEAIRRSQAVKAAVASGLARARGSADPYRVPPGGYGSVPFGGYYAQRNARSMEALRAQVASNPSVFYGSLSGNLYGSPPPPGGGGSPVVAATQRGGLFSRLNGPFAANPNLSLAATFGLPFLGGAVSQLGGSGGDLRSAGVGGLSGALNGAGLGAGLGSIIPGIGTAGGAIIGGIVGGLAGALGKITKSYESLADENAKRVEGIKGDFDKVAKVFEAQAQLAEAIRNGASPQKLAELRGNEARALGGIDDQKVKSLIIGGLSNPGTEGKANSLLTASAVKAGGITDFTQAVSLARSATSSFPTFGFADGIDIPVPKLNQPNVNGDVVKSLSSTFGPLISQLSTAELAQFQAFANKNPRGALQTLGSRAGLTDEQLKGLNPNLAERGTFAGSNFNAEIKQAISTTIAQNTNPDLLIANQETTKAAVDYSKALEKLSGDYAIAAKNTATLSEGFQKVSQSIAQTVLATSNVTEAEKLRLTRGFEEQTITSAFASQRQQATLGGRGQLLSLLSRAGIDNTATFGAVNRATTAADFQALASKGLPSLQEADQTQYVKLAQETVDKLTEISTSEAVSLVVARTTNDLLQIQNSQRERDTLLRNSRFDPASFNQINSQSRQGNLIGVGRFNRGARIENLLGSQQGIDALGLPATSQSLAYTERLQTERTKYSLAAILTQRTGKKVGTDDASLLAAAQGLISNPGREGDAALGSQVVAAVGAKNFSAQAGIDKIKASIGGDQATFNKAVGATNLSLGDQSLVTVANDIGGSGGTNDLLTDIRDALVNGDYARVLKENTEQLTQAIQAAEVLKSSGGTPEQIANAQKVIQMSADKFNQTRAGYKPDLTAFGKQAAQTLGTAGAPSGQSVTIDENGKVTRMEDFHVTSPKEKGSAFGGFGTGFQSEIDNTTHAISDLSAIGAQTAQSLQSRLDGVWTSFSTGAERGRDAFRSFAAGITGDLSRAFANQAFSGLLNGLFNSGGSGSPGLLNSLFSHNANGGVPTMAMGGEFFVGPGAARAIGYDKLAAMNRAGGGMITGGSGLRDDVPMMSPQGSFILKKSAVQRIGPSNLQAMVNGRAMGGRIGMADGGAPPSGYYQNGLSSSGNSDPNAAGASDSSGAGSSYAGAGASAALAVIALLVEKLFQTTYHTLDTAGVVRNAGSLQAEQQNTLNSQAPGFHAFKVSDGRGNYSIINEGQPGTTAVEQNFSADGGVIGPVVPLSSSSSSGGMAPSVAITIHHYGDSGGSSSSVQTKGGGNDIKSNEFLEQLGKAVRNTVQDELTQQARQGGFFTQNKRYTPNNQVS